MASRDIEHLLILAELYGSNKAIALSTVSLYAAGQGRLMERLRAGCQITVGRRDRILQWFSDHWPAGLDWPQEIERPGLGSPDPGGGAAPRVQATAATGGARSRGVPPGTEIPARFP